jgi:hypothetical protein
MTKPILTNATEIQAKIPWRLLQKEKGAYSYCIAKHILTT